MSENMDPISPELIKEMDARGEQIIREFENDKAERDKIIALLNHLSEAVSEQDDVTSTAETKRAAQTKFSEITKELDSMGHSIIDYYGDFEAGALFSVIADKLIKIKKAKDK